MYNIIRHCEAISHDVHVSYLRLLFFRRASRRAICKRKTEYSQFSIPSLSFIISVHPWSYTVAHSDGRHLPVSPWRSVCLLFWRSDCVSSSWSSSSSSSPCCSCWRVGSVWCASWQNLSGPSVPPGKIKRIVRTEMMWADRKSDKNNFVNQKYPQKI